MKLAFFLSLCCVSSMAFADACLSASYHYTLTGKADGDMIKTISCEGPMMTINSQVHVQKFTKKISIEQTVMGSYSSDQFTPTLSTTEDSRINDGAAVDTKLNYGEYDTLSLVYAFEKDLSAGVALPTDLNVLENEQVQAFHVTQESGVKLDTALGSLDTIKVTLSTKDATLTYWFASLEEGYYTMVQSDITRAGERVFLAKLQA